MSLVRSLCIPSQVINWMSQEVRWALRSPRNTSCPLFVSVIICMCVYSCNHQHKTVLVWYIPQKVINKYLGIITLLIIIIPRIIAIVKERVAFHFLFSNLFELIVSIRTYGQTVQQLCWKLFKTVKKLVSQFKKKTHPSFKGHTAGYEKWDIEFSSCNKTQEHNEWICCII